MKIISIKTEVREANVATGAEISLTPASLKQVYSKFTQVNISWYDLLFDMNRSKGGMVKYEYYAIMTLITAINSPLDMTSHMSKCMAEDPAFSDENAELFKVPLYVEGLTGNLILNKEIFLGAESVYQAMNSSELRLELSDDFMRNLSIQWHAFQQDENNRSTMSEVVSVGYDKIIIDLISDYFIVK